MDTREAILARLGEVAAGIDGIVYAARNRVEHSEHPRPAIIVLDGDETADDDAFGRGRPARGPLIVRASPEVYILAAATSTDVGPALNRLRARLIRAVLTDADLRGLCHDGDIRYEGSATGLAAGRSLEGEMGLQFSFAYRLIPDEL